MVPVYDKTKTFPYSLKADVDEVKTIFRFKAFDAKEQSYLQNHFTRVEMREVNGKTVPEITIDNASRALETIRLGLKSIENFGDVKLVLEPVRYPFGMRDVVPYDILDMMTPYINELATVVMLENTFTKEAEKN